MDHWDSSPFKPIVNDFGSDGFVNNVIPLTGINSNESLSDATILSCPETFIVLNAEFIMPLGCIPQVALTISPPYGLSILGTLNMYELFLHEILAKRDVLSLINLCVAFNYKQTKRIGAYAVSFLY